MQVAPAVEPGDAAVYLVLRCAVYLVNASKSRVALRFLAKAEETTRTEAGEPCTVQDDDQPEAAAGAAGAEREGEVLLVDDLLERARRYVTELETLLRVNTFVFTQLDNALKFMLVAEFLCLCLMEFSALYSLMERRERAGMQELISNIYIKIQSLGNRMNWRQLTPARRRHIQFLYSLFDRLSEVDPPTGAFEERQRLSRMKELLTLQEMALGQLDYGFSALRECVESGRKRSDDPKAGASPAKGAAAATQGAVAPPDVPEAPESVTVRSVFMAIERTAHKRRDQNLMDKHLSAWMRMKHYEKPHYSIMSTHRLLKATGQPMQTHKELLEDLQATPLGLRDVSVRATSGTGIYTDKTTASSSVQEEPSQEKKESPQDNHDSRALGPLERPSQHSPTGPGTEGPSPAAASPGTSTAAGGVPAAQTNQPAVEAPSHGETVPIYTAPNRPPQVSSPAAPGHLQGSAVSAAAEPVTVPSAGVHSPQALWTTNASTAAPVGRVSSPSSSDEALPRPPPSSFTAAVSSAAAYSPQSFTLRTPSTAAQPPSTSPAFDTPRASVPTEPLPTPSPSSSSAAVPSAAALAQEALTLSAPTAAAQPAVFSDPHFAPWVSPSSLSIWAPLSASHWSPAVSAPTQGGIDSSPLPSSLCLPLRGYRRNIVRLQELPDKKILRRLTLGRLPREYGDRLGQFPHDPLQASLPLKGPTGEVIQGSLQDLRKLQNSSVGQPPDIHQ
ncbi:uncharacterized protein EMH_0015230 [Eimeria mitis]|uniref:Uncharacterized protein n=1 Tax=Eimeria mitis TaxID=44415 RepID=U6K5P3_9EIME|nr:uncharacterized protein EMH_0015230 [Eimeria mitis]CDJ33235.1 hypothetical protein EMH_0015230 [Eimeria mitis]